MLPVMELRITPNGLKDLAYWAKNNPKKALKILALFQEITKNPFQGTGKPEPLKHQFSGCWSRRIDQEHRLVYLVKKNLVEILACRYHY